MILNDLPIEHELRNKPLIDIGAQYQIRDSKVWATVTAPYGIAKKTFNELDSVWTKWDVWRATK
jgi:hypothetical protein